MNVDVASDQAGKYHYLAYEPGVKNGRRDARSLCGDYARNDLREAAWFALFDRRGRVYYERACETCADLLRY